MDNPRTTLCLENMANVCERCKRSMSSHDDHASCPQCRMAAGECHLDIEKPCNICGGWTSKQWGKLRRSLVDARARASQRGRQHWTAAFPRLEAWIRPVSASISSLVGEGDFDDNLLVSTPNLLVEQVLVVQTQNGVNVGYGHYGTQYGHYSTQYGTPAVNSRVKHNGTDCFLLVHSKELRTRPVSFKELRTRPVSFKELSRSLVRSRQCSLLQDTAPSRTAVYGTPAVRCHACYVSKAFLPNGLLWSGQSVPSYA